MSPPVRPLATALFEWLSAHRVVLASASPRRQQLLAQLGLHPEICVSGFAEDLDRHALGPIDYCRETAARKAMAVYETMADKEETEVQLVIAADTVVVTQDGTVLEKPADRENHIRMLRTLRDAGTHKVLTGIACVVPLSVPVQPGYVLRTLQDVVETTVRFAADAMSDELIEAYVDSAEAAGAAGGYQIQGRGALFVERIEGDYNNVVGLPLQRLLVLIETTLRTEQEDLGRV